MKKLTENDIINISEDYLKGMSYEMLSKKYNICTWSIGNALRKMNVPSRIRKHKCDENYFEKIDNSEKAYWLGLLFSDGYVRKRRQNNGKFKQGGIIGISLKKGDEYLLNKFINDVESDYKLYETKRGDFVSYKLEINSSKMADDLINLGCVPNKSLILKPPKIKKIFIPHFIRGYFDGDGSVGKYNGRIKISFLGTYEILSWILEFFLVKGIERTPKISKKKNIYTIQFNSFNDVEKIKKIIYTSSKDYFLIRKKEKFN